MSHTLTRIFIDANGGIDVRGDIAYVLGRNTGDVGQLCGDVDENGQALNPPKINKWARFKPVGYNKRGVLTEQERASVNYGLSAPNARQNFLDTLSSPYNVWTYAPPQGGSANQPYRVLDFDGYRSDAPPPVDPPGDIDISISTTAAFSFGAYISHNLSGGDAISWEDLPASVGNYYLCVIFAKNSDFSGDLLAKTSEQTINDDGLVLDISNSELTTLSNGGYGYYYLVARSVQLNGLQAPSTNTANYLALPCAGTSNNLKGKFTIRAAAVASIIITKFSPIASPTRALNFLPAADYIGPESATPVQSEYANYSSEPYYLHLALDVTAGGSNLTILNPKLSLSQTFFSGSGFSTLIGCTLYDSSFTQQTQVVIPAGTTQTIYLVAASPLLSLNQGGSQSSGASNQRFSTMVRVYNGNTLIDATNEIRVRNYSF